MNKKTKLTVLQVLPELNSGGVERGTIELAEKLVEEGHRSIVISNGGSLVKNLTATGSEHIQLPVHKKSFLSFFQVKPLVRHIDLIQPDIIHVRSRLPAWLIRYALKKCRYKNKIKLISTVHGLYSVNRYSQIMTRADHIIAVSNTVKGYILKNYPEVNENKITVIFRGVDSNKFNPSIKRSKKWLKQWQQDFPTTKDKRILTLPGRVTRLKGHQEFLKLIAKLKSQKISIHGLIVGDIHQSKQSYFEEIKQQIKKLDIEEMISFTGLREDIAEIYQYSDIVYSLSSKPESFGRTVLEPLVMGKMVLGWSHGGVGEILEAIYPQGQVPLGNSDLLYQKTLALLENSDLPAKENPFTQERMFNSTLNLYQNVVEND